MPWCVTESPLARGSANRPLWHRYYRQRAIEAYLLPCYVRHMASPKDVLAALDSVNPSPSRSPLARWMRQNHDDLVARLGNKRADWTTLAKVFEDAGLTDRSGKPPTAETTRKTWVRVAQEVARDPRQQAARPSAPTQSTDEGVVRKAVVRVPPLGPNRADASSQHDDDDPLGDKPAFRFGRPR